MINVYTSTDWKEYELLDSGDGKKLERFGKYIVDRIETQALWHKSLPQSDWDRADAIFRKNDERGEWIKRNIPNEWVLSYDDIIKLQVRLTPFGHVGVFPDQANQWTSLYYDLKDSFNRVPKVLTLFGYTGASTLIAAAAGSEVTHVDASKPAITWARENANLSGLSNKPIRWIPEDALKFVKREVRRGTRYDAIIMDPPKFGRGTQGEVWKFEENFTELLDYCRQILSEDAILMSITAYAVPISAITLENLLTDVMRKHKGKINACEIGLKQSSNGRILPTALSADWSREPQEQEENYVKRLKTLP